MIYLLAQIMHWFGECTEYYTLEEDKGKCCICGKMITDSND